MTGEQETESKPNERNNTKTDAVVTLQLLLPATCANSLLRGGHVTGRSGCHDTVHALRSATNGCALCGPLHGAWREGSVAHVCSDPVRP